MLKLQAEFTNMLVFWQKLLNLLQGVQVVNPVMTVHEETVKFKVRIKSVTALDLFKIYWISKKM